MAIWYVRSGATGSGTGPGLAQAWGTITQAVAAGSGVTGGDTVWIAPGVYRETPTIGFTNPTSTVNFFGDPTASQFPGVSPAPVRVTTFTVSDNSTTSTSASFTSSRDYTYFRDIVFVCTLALSGSNLTMYRCVFESAPLNISPTATTTANITIDSCTSLGTQGFTFDLPKASSNYSASIVVKNCLIILNNVTNVGIRFQPKGSGAGWITDALVTNCTVIGGARCVDTSFAAGFTGRAVLLQNSILNGFSFVLVSDVSGQIQYQNCRIIGSINGPTSISGNTTTMSYMGLEFGQSKLGGIPNPQLLANIVGSVNIGWGTTSNAPSVDLYGNTWTTALPDAGSGAYASVASTSFYVPTERNASTITIAPGSTSQSIELYLGATGLTASTSGLSARYNRSRSASVSIPLAARTITQPWVARCYRSVDPVEMPGVYRLDIPNEALLGGADDCTVVVRGASGTNGAVMGIRLERQTTLISTTGYKLISDQLGANGILDVIKGSSITVKLQMVDVNNKPIPVGSSTCTVEVYSINNLVETYPTVIQYQSNGEMTFVLDTQVTATPGTYNIYVVRNNGGSDTVLYGPMKLVVSNL